MLIASTAYVDVNEYPVFIHVYLRYTPFAWIGTIGGTFPRYMHDESLVCAGLRVSGKALVLDTDTLNKSGAFLYLLIHTPYTNSKKKKTITLTWLAPEICKRYLLAPPQNQ